MSVGVVVLAAGQGTRMRSHLPKVLHRVAGRTLVDWVLTALTAASPVDTVVVVGHDADAVRAALPEGVRTALQEEQRGTGHAARIGLDALDPSCEHVIVACGDTPLLTADLIAALCERHALGAPATAVTATLGDPTGYGRIIRGPGDRIASIVEQRDATEGQREVREINVGLYAFRRDVLESCLGRLRADNDQGELYLTDAIGLLDGEALALESPDPDVVLGVNTRAHLAECERIIQDRLREALLVAGVTMQDPRAVYLEPGVTVGPDTVLWPGTHLRGATAIGEGCEIGPDVVLADCVVGDGTRIVSANCAQSEIGRGCEIGPFAYLRPGVTLEDGAKVGTFVEVKASRLGRGAKVPHLSYIGDADVGAGTNIGAGNITANYDGFRKHRTVIGEGVKTGSDCVFVAPVEVGDHAMTGAGSIITHPVPAGALGIARARQSVIEGFTEKAVAKATAESEAQTPDTGGH